MKRQRLYWVYMLASKGRVIYVGVTGFIVSRVLQHKSGEMKGFAQRYHCDRLVYFEVYKYVNNAIAREKEIKAWRREKKVALIESLNPTWEDLAEGWDAREVPPLRFTPRREKQIPHA